MLFDSISFVLFLPLVFVLYWFIVPKNLKLQNGLLLIASYYFYACWDWRFLFLLFFSTLLDYASGIKIAQVQKISSKRLWFWLSVCINLGFLAVFKYYNFFAVQLCNGLEQLGLEVNPFLISVILPVGISFYTFHGLSYVIDIYKGRIKPERNFINYGVFVSFFPLLVAGPIERAQHLLPQIKEARQFRYSEAVDGLKQILWGLFKKIVIADQCAIYSDFIFDSSAQFSGPTLVLGALLFTIRIYGDFSGYSDIALGTARLFGIELLRNFAFPYFSRNMAEFWRRWHISLSSWFRDYLYIPLGGSRGTLWIKIRNVLIIFLVSGFWHGANWTFIVWGLLNAFFVLPSVFMKTNRNNLNIVAEGSVFPSLREFLGMSLTFGLTVFAWIFFRSPDITFAYHYVDSMIRGMNDFVFYQKTYEIIYWKIGYLQFVWILLFFVLEWFGRERNYAIATLGNRLPTFLRWSFYLLLLLLVICYSGTDQQFIYFQF